MKWFDELAEQLEGMFSGESWADNLPAELQEAVSLIELAWSNLSAKGDEENSALLAVALDKIREGSCAEEEDNS